MAWSVLIAFTSQPRWSQVRYLKREMSHFALTRCGHNGGKLFLISEAIPVHHRRPWFNRRNATLALVSLLAAQAGLVAWAAYRYAPVTDEPGQLAAGLSHWKLGRFELYRVTPPLVRSVAALPVLFADHNTDWSHYPIGIGTRADGQVGMDFLQANGSRSFWLMTTARWACIPFALLGGLVCFLWARDLYGTAGGILAPTLWCFSPDILGHGCLITTDVAGASLSIATFYIFRRWLLHRAWTAAVFAGICLGLVLLAKATYVIYFGLLPALWLLWNLRRDTQSPPSAWRRDILQLATLFVTALYVVNTAYAFDGSLKRLGKYVFVSQSLAGEEVEESVGGNRFADTPLGLVPVPFPEQYVLGVDLQRTYFEHRMLSYLGGEWKRGGWWYYYLYGLAVKMPLGTWILLLLAASLTVSGRFRGTLREDLLLLAPSIVILVLVSSQTGFNKNLRYVMAIYPFLFIWIGRVLALAAMKVRWVRPATLLAAGWAVGSSLWVYPHSLSYFNEAAGGPTEGHRHLIHTNIDQGQDLLYLRDWVIEHPSPEPLYVAYYGIVDPTFAGIRYSLPRRDPLTGRWPPGRYAVSVNMLRGHRWMLPTGQGRWEGIDDDRYASFLDREPIGRAGYSIYIYDVSGEEAQSQGFRATEG